MFSNKKFLLFAFLFTIWFHLTKSSKIGKINITQFDCDCNLDVFEKWSCTVVSTKIGPSFTLDYYLRRSVNNLLVNMQVFSKTNQGPYIAFPINVTADICGYFKGKPQTFYLGFIMKQLKNKSNMVHACPYSGHMYAKNVTIKNIPIYTPKGEYRIDLKYYEKTLAHEIGRQSVYALLQ